MKETLILSKILLKNSLNINNGKSKLKATAKKLLVFFAVAYIACVMGFLSVELINTLKTVNQTGIFLSLCLILTVAVSLIRSIISSLQLLYFSKDIEYLLPLPISALKIVLAKFNVIIISSYVLEIFTLAIPLIIYGIYMMQEVHFFIMTGIVFMFLPIIPTILSALISIVLMRFTNIFKNKDTVQYITVIMAFVLVIVMQFYIMNNSEMTEFMFANKLLEVDGIAKELSNYVIIVKQAFISLTEFEGLEYVKNAILLVGESITVYLLTGLLTAKTYIKSATNITSVKRVKNAKLNISKRSIARSYIDKEVKMLFRTPAFFLNTVLPIFILPVLLVLPFIDVDMASAEDISIAIKIISENLQNTMGLAIILCIMLFLYIFNYISVTSISREGENAIIMKYLPIDLNKQCRYKAVPGFLLNLFPILLVTIGIKFIFSVNNIFILEILLIGLILNVFINYCGVLIDIINPKLHWTTEYSVVKQNINMLWYMLFMIALGFAIFAICSCFDNIHIVTMLLIAILAITIAFLDNFVKQYNINLFKKIS